MSVTNYTELLASVASWANRDDLDATVIPDWIAFFEARARRELRDWLTSTVSLTNLTGDTALAATVEEVISVAYNDGAAGVLNAPLDLLSFEDYHQRMACDSSVRAPVQGVYLDRDEVADSYTLRFYPPVSAASPLANLAVLAVGVLPSLGASQATNRLLAVAPEAYIKGSLIEGAEYLEHDERIQVWKGEVADIFHGLRLQTERKRTGSYPRPVRLPVVFG